MLSDYQEIQSKQIIYYSYEIAFDEAANRHKISLKFLTFQLSFPSS